MTSSKPNSLLFFSFFLIIFMIQTSFYHYGVF